MTPITLRFKHDHTVVYISAQPSDTISEIKNRLAFAINDTKSNTTNSNTTINNTTPQTIRIGLPLLENDFSAGFKEIKSTANGKDQKLDAAGIKSDVSLVFTTDLDSDFFVVPMKDEYYADDDL